MDKDGDGTVATTNIASNAKVVHDATSETADAEFKAENEQYDSSTQKNAYGDDVNAGTVKDCGAGNHSYGEKIFVDSTHIYEVCSCCGYTLITVQDTAGNEVKQTKNTLDANGNATTEVSCPVMTLATSESIDNSDDDIKNYAIKTEEVDGKQQEVVVMETPNVEKELDQSTCDHDFNEGVITTAPTCTSTGVKTYTCSKCSETYSITVAKAAHKYYDNIGYVHKDDETCSVCGQERSTTAVAKIGSTEYATLEAAIAAVQANETATIVMLQDDAAYITQVGSYAAWHINSGKNITIDLAGYTLKNLIGYANDEEEVGLYPSANNGVFYVAPGSSLTIKDSSCSYGSTTDGTGTIYNELAPNVPQTYWSSVSSECVNRQDTVILNEGTFTLQSGTLDCRVKGMITYAIDSNTTTNVTINGGILKGTGCPCRIRKGTCTFNNDCQVLAGGSRAVMSQTTQGKTDVIFNGGTFVGGFYIESTSNVITYTMNGGYYSTSDIPSSFIPAGKDLIFDVSTGYYTIGVAKYQVVYNVPGISYISVSSHTQIENNLNNTYVNAWSFWGAEGYKDADGNECPQYVLLTDTTVYDNENKTDAFSGSIAWSNYFSKDKYLSGYIYQSNVEATMYFASLTDANAFQASNGGTVSAIN